MLNTLNVFFKVKSYKIFRKVFKKIFRIMEDIQKSDPSSVLKILEFVTDARNSCFLGQRWPACMAMPAWCSSFVAFSGFLGAGYGGGAGGTGRRWGDEWAEGEGPYGADGGGDGRAGGLTGGKGAAGGRASLWYLLMRFSRV